MVRRSLGLILALGLALAGARSVLARDYWDLSYDFDPATTNNELIHGTSQQHDLDASAGADQDWYVVISYPRSSYEAVIDSTSYLLNMFDLANFQRLDAAGVTIFQTSENVNVGSSGGFSTGLRWQSVGTTVDRQSLRVHSAFCDGSPTTCGIYHQYRIRFYDTTVAVPRFNNASGQVTVLIIQNQTEWNRPIAGTAYFFNAAGTVLGSTTFSLASNAALVLNTATVPGVAGVSGTIKVAHDGGYGNLAMKAVALEPATGFSFDTPGTYKPQ